MKLKHFKIKIYNEIDKLNKDIEEGLNDPKSFEGHSAMKKLMEKYE